MTHFIIADNQELTRQGIESIVQKDDEATVYRATDRAGLVQLLEVCTTRRLG